MTLTPSVESMLRSNAQSVRSPLNLRSSLVLLAVLVLVTLLTFGTVVLAIFLVPGVRQVGPALLGAVLPVHAALLLLVIHRGLRRAGTGWRELGFTRPTVRIFHLLWQIPLVLVALVTVQLLTFAITGDSPAPEGGGGVESLVAGTGPLVALAVFLGVAILTPLWEEAIFRGIVHGGLRRRLGRLGASFISAAIFAAAHGVPILLPYMVTLGLALALLREFHKTLWAPVIMHALLNSLVTGTLVVSVLT
ncbi:CPBP family intramembrane metalloprotease [Saxibacter everestensis]|uniref:CPBP family intramembrane metalloprotease n=1 Tax=Saxibacter everestensis TaxID=2909229 RepID=A0ABY8QQZ9_9MICO|nr:CPBP family intramembrane metalloprotease [Brevibacteriaceae bacterium ZFBP1038]